MPQNDVRATGYFVLTIAVAMVLRVMALFPDMAVFNPDWVLLVLMYWCVAIPERVGVFNAWMVGLLTDVLTGRLLGQYALIYALIGYAGIKLHRRLRQYPLPQQCIYVFFCLLVSQSMVFLTESMQAAAERFDLSFWYPVATGTALWPVVFIVLRFVRVFARIA